MGGCWPSENLKAASFGSIHNDGVNDVNDLEAASAVAATTSIPGSSEHDATRKSPGILARGRSVPVVYGPKRPRRELFQRRTSSKRHGFVEAPSNGTTDSQRRTALRPSVSSLVKPSFL